MEDEGRRAGDGDGRSTEDRRWKMKDDGCGRQRTEDGAWKTKEIMRLKLLVMEMNN